MEVLEGQLRLVDPTEDLGRSNSSSFTYGRAHRGRRTSDSCLIEAQRERKERTVEASVEKPHDPTRLGALGRDCRCKQEPINKTVQRGEGGSENYALMVLCAPESTKALTLWPLTSTSTARAQSGQVSPSLWTRKEA